MKSTQSYKVRIYERNSKLQEQVIKKCPIFAVIGRNRRTFNETIKTERVKCKSKYVDEKIQGP